MLERTQYPCTDCVLAHPHDGVCTDKYGSAATEPGCLHPDCVLEHPHVGPAILKRPE